MVDTLACLVPILLLIAARLALPEKAIDNPVVRALVMTGFAVLMLRYFWWRVTVTVLPADTLDLQSVFVWGIFAVEIIAWFDSLVGLLALSRRSDRRAEADRGEARPRATDPADLPVVDIMIATYNEPLDVLERTIVGALAVDWPADKLRVWVLDDGRRDWLRAYCAETGAGYLTRPDNSHAKAGNINAGIARTDGDYFLVLDADFVPRQTFLYRTVGFFDDPRIGIVQIPHSVFNHDPMQTSLGMQRDMPDDQRFFFDAVMPGRDGWDCAFCCGSNGIVRRAAMEAIGNKLPAGSITEDMLLTMALLRKGYVTRYLNERLAVGLAPESLAAFFVQRARWARGAIQLLFLREGPLGPGLTPIQRAMFLPTHWISQSLSQIVAMSTPAVYLLTGLLPLVNANATTVLAYQVPAILGAIMVIRLYAPWQYYPIAATTHGVLQAFRLLPTILVTLVKPHGHAFKVTPKGQDAMGGPQVDMPTVVMATVLTFATAVGLLLNANINTRIVEVGALIPIVAFWAILNMVVLMLVATIAVSPPVLRAEERFDLMEPVRLRHQSGTTRAELLDMSLSGALLSVSQGDAAGPAEFSVGDWMLVGIADVGHIRAQIMRRIGAGAGAKRYGLRFDLPRGDIRNALIRRLFTLGLDNSVKNAPSGRITRGMIARIFRDPKVSAPHAAGPRPILDLAPPAWLFEIERAADVTRELDAWARDLRAEASHTQSAAA